MQHFFNFQGSAQFGILAFLGLGFVSFAAAVALIVLWIKRRRQLAKRVCQGAIAVWVLYFATLLGYSLTSHEQVAGPKVEKYFCEVDCHLAYSVLDVTRNPTLGAPPNQSAARGVYYVVTIRTRFDEDTISARRSKDLPLRPNSRLVAIVDAEGKRYPESPTGVHALESTEGPRVPLTLSLRPGESYTTKLVFDLPPMAREPRLEITEADWITHLLIGHENSFLHKRTRFSLES
jgi:hypothetical protein